jgi:hypothetical protein
VQAKREPFAEYGRDFLALKRSPALGLDEDTIYLSTVVVEEFLKVCGKTFPEEVTETDVIRYCNRLEQHLSDRTRSTRYTSLRDFSFTAGWSQKGSSAHPCTRS